MMYAELYQYLLLNKKLPVPGIGTFLLERKPAESDFSNRTLNPPVHSFGFQTVATAPPTNFFNWLASALQISDQDAMVRFNDFARELKNQITNGGIIEWNGVGIISKGLGNEVKFRPLENNLALQTPVAAEKIIRQHAEHMVRVGEDNKTSAEMVEMLNQPDEKKSYWWAFAAAVALLGFIFLGWYFSEHGVDVAATMNNKALVPLTNTAATYQLQP